MVKWIASVYIVREIFQDLYERQGFKQQLDMCEEENPEIIKIIKDKWEEITDKGLDMHCDNCSYNPDSLINEKKNRNL